MIETSDEQTPLTPVTVLGLGPMGRALASAFLNAGHQVTVWNRTSGKAGDLLDHGAVAAGSVQEAVRAGQVIIVCLIDYDAVQATLEPSQADWENRCLVNLTSGEPAQARQMSEWASSRGIDYLDGAILTPTPAIGTPSAAVLFSGAHDVYEAVQETMSAVGGAAVHLGDDPGQASAYEVALLDIFATSVNGIVHAFALASAEGIEPERFAAFATGIGGLLPEMITRFARQIQTGHYPGDRSTIASAASGITHIINTATTHGIDVGMLTAAKGIIDQAVADGYGTQGLARLSTMLHTRAVA
ncbi:dehydrogenase [Streptomyces cinnamoneus]|uniref:Dehydrogenase n=1 Tax=Streptomyces cinnamoneus TaxID=53446 RepID=A0A2G1XMA0_STRCJ|nr:NAD(P)-binding domain-containing protein [Streptomyces cinnamoneus]PHQ52372.1 dehydrogenase [Streptomyces cinnamoneus]PPT11574.1 NAD(P)-dependent oxidoreductase [Streptomyces cinnamoneus]